MRSVADVSRKKTDHIETSSQPSPQSLEAIPGHGFVTHHMKNLRSKQ